MPFQCYTFRTSETTPIAEGAASDFREVSPGVWLPYKAEVAALNPMVLMKSGAKKPNWTKTFLVTEASLNPKYDQAYFKDVEFPDGTFMYEVDGGKIKRTFVKGGPKEKPVGVPPLKN